MESPTVEDNNEIEVKFIYDHEVVHIINDETFQHKDTKPKNKANTSLIQGNTSNDEEFSESELDVVLKPKALFEDGDVPGERMFSFNSKQTKTSKSKSCLQKTPTSLKTSIKNVASPQFEKNHDLNDQKLYSIRPQVLFDDENEFNSKTSLKKFTRGTSKTTTVISKKELSDDNDSQISSDCKLGFETPKKSKLTHVNGSKIQNSVEHISSTISTPKSSKSRKYVGNENMLTKTPRAVRKQIAKGIAHQKFVQQNESADSDYSVSEKSDESDNDSSDHSNTKTVELKENNSIVTLRRSTRKKEVPFVYKSDEYFLSKSTKSLKKSKTSDNTLKLLKNPALEKEQVDQLSKNSNTAHDEKFKAMYKEIVSNFPYWLCLLKEGFNLLLYGFGSKRQILNDFRTSMLEEESVLVINGFFPGLTLKEILESISIDLLALDSCPSSAELALHQIEEKQKLKNAESIYILIHNLDGVELQNFKTQHVLSRICSLKNVHLIASIDRVNAALMFDNTKLGNYNFLWMDCTNYLPYTIETDFIQSLMVKNIGAQHSFSGLNNVYKSLTSNTKRILLLLIKDRIDNKNDKKYGGVPFSILYRWCRQRFLVSTDLALRSQLTEFVDHELVKWKRDADVLYVPVDVDVLIKFYKQNEEDDE